MNEEKKEKNKQEFKNIQKYFDDFNEEYVKELEDQEQKKKKILKNNNNNLKIELNDLKLNSTKQNEINKNLSEEINLLKKELLENKNIIKELETKNINSQKELELGKVENLKLANK